MVDYSVKEFDFSLPNNWNIITKYKDNNNNLLSSFVLMVVTGGDDADSDDDVLVSTKSHILFDDDDDGDEKDDFAYSLILQASSCTIDNTVPDLKSIAENKVGVFVFFLLLSSSALTTLYFVIIFQLFGNENVKSLTE